MVKIKHPSQIKVGDLFLGLSDRVYLVLQIQEQEWDYHVQWLNLHNSERFEQFVIKGNINWDKISSL
jgi:hypothetical protein